MNICILDTETIGIDKPFVYDIGYIIYNTKERKILQEKTFMVEQIWHNLPLFHTSYYADKRPIYIGQLRSRQTKLEKIGYITQKMLYTFKHFNVAGIYAYNSPFDDRVFSFNCDWFKIRNPLEELPVFDIRGYAHQFIANKEDFLVFCEDNQLLTEAKNYSTTAESIYKYITNNPDFKEKHLALDDSRIETEILEYCVNNGAQWQTEYQTVQSIVREVPQPLKIVVDNKTLYNGSFRKKYIRLGLYKFTT